MKHLIKVGLLTLVGAFALFLYVPMANAACTSLEAPTSEIVNGTMIYTVTASCTPGSWSGYAIHYYNKDGDPILIGSLTPSNNLSFPAPSGTQAGPLQILLVSPAGDIVANTTITITTNNNTGTLKCGDKVAPSDASLCPPGCPQSTMRDGATVPSYCSCGGLNQPKCADNNTSNSPACTGSEIILNGQGQCVSKMSSTLISVDLRGDCQGVNEIDTAIGCVPIGDVNSFAAFFLKWGLGIAGGVAILFFVYASFLIMTSQGDPKRLQVGRELLMSAIAGIIMLALSVFIFRILGVNILGLF